MGENCEQLWAMLRPLLKQTRYMTKDGYVFCIDDALLLIADNKLGSFVPFMKQLQQAAAEKLGECMRQLRLPVEHKAATCSTTGRAQHVVSVSCHIYVTLSCMMQSGQKQATQWLSS